MDFNEYQKKADSIEKLWQPKDSLIYTTLSVVGEAGEIAEKIKKVIRDENGIISESKKNEIAKEIGDCQWGLAALCTHLGISLQEVAEQNITKLQSREKRGVLSGNGDNR